MTENIGYTAANSLCYDVALQISKDGGKTWTNVTAEDDFPKEGLTVLLDYPTGTGRNTHDFVVTHMLSHSVGNKEAGDTETLAVTKTEKGLQVTLYSLSPIGIAWKPVQVSDDKDPDKSQTGVTQTQGTANVQEAANVQQDVL